MASAIPNTLSSFLRNSMGLLGREMRGLFHHGPRMMLAAQTVGSVLLAVMLANLFSLDDRWWVAISAYVVMRADWATSFDRGMQRMAGTLVGAAFSLLLAPYATHYALVYSLILGGVTGVGVFATLDSHRSYGWLLGTITVLLVLSDLHDRGSDATHVAWQRVSAIAVGTVSCITVAGVVQLGRHYLQWSPAAAPASSAKSSPDSRKNLRSWRLRAWQALPGAITIAGLSFIDFYRPFNDFAEMLVTITVVPIVPMAVLLHRDRSEAAVSQRMANRVLGCLLAAALTFLMIPWIKHSALLYLLVLSVGVWLAAHVQSGHADVSYIGLQFGIAFLMVFVQDTPWSIDMQPAILRLIGILAGVLTLALVRLATDRVRRLLPSRD